ncbi:hypothetical protein AURDEDRAFT_172313 [Auricularia subglabra TFB-10046 SS5]|nr:hypothetical protein AURDEDRAFT_172313 [Auricularia subglabra TFB-10046 SS5]
MIPSRKAVPRTARKAACHIECPLGCQVYMEAFPSTVSRHLRCKIHGMNVSMAMPIARRVVGDLRLLTNTYNDAYALGRLSALDPSSAPDPASVSAFVQPGPDDVIESELDSDDDYEARGERDDPLTRGMPSSPLTPSPTAGPSTALTRTPTKVLGPRNRDDADDVENNSPNRRPPERKRVRGDPEAISDDDPSLVDEFELIEALMEDQPLARRLITYPPWSPMQNASPPSEHPAQSSSQAAALADGGIESKLDDSSDEDEPGVPGPQGPAPPPVPTVSALPNNVTGAGTAPVIQATVLQAAPTPPAPSLPIINVAATATAPQNVGALHLLRASSLSSRQSLQSLPPLTRPLAPPPGPPLVNATAPATGAIYAGPLATSTEVLAVQVHPRSHYHASIIPRLCNADRLALCPIFPDARPALQLPIPAPHHRDPAFTPPGWIPPGVLEFYDGVFPLLQRRVCANHYALGQDATGHATMRCPLRGQMNAWFAVADFDGQSVKLHEVKTRPFYEPMLHRVCYRCMFPLSLHTGTLGCVFEDIILQLLFLLFVHHQPALVAAAELPEVDDATTFSNYWSMLKLADSEGYPNIFKYTLWAVAHIGVESVGVPPAH